MKKLQNLVRLYLNYYNNKNCKVYNFYVQNKNDLNNEVKVIIKIIS